MGSEGEGDSKVDSQVLACVSGWMPLPFTEMGKAQGGGQTVDPFQDILNEAKPARGGD